MTGWRRLLAAIATLAGAAAVIALAAWLALSYQYRQLSQTIEDSLRAEALDEAALVAALAANDPRGDQALVAGPQRRKGGRGPARRPPTAPAGDRGLCGSLPSPPQRRLTVIAPDGHVLY